MRQVKEQNMLKDLEVCSNGHPAIAHNGGYKGCPMCELMATGENPTRIKTLEIEISDLEDRIDELECGCIERDAEIKRLKQELAEAKG